MTVAIELNRGLVAIIDDQDLPIIKRYTWHSHVHASGHIYARTNVPSGETGKRQKGLLMHRLIMGISDPKIKCDHIDGNGLNNTRGNMRICSVAQNGMNRGAQRNSFTGVKGVSPCGKKFAATIRINGKQKHLGCFCTIEEAKEVYDRAAMENHGEFYNTLGPKQIAKIPTPVRKKYKGQLNFSGENKSVEGWALFFGISASAMYRRLKKYGSIDEVVRNSDADLFKRMVQEATGITTFVWRGECLTRIVPVPEQTSGQKLPRTSPGDAQTIVSIATQPATRTGSICESVKIGLPKN